MLDEISWEQFVEWQEFFRLEPFGYAVEEIRLARLLSHTATLVAGGRRGGGAFSALDFLPQALVDDHDEAPARQPQRRSLPTGDAAGGDRLGSHDRAGWDAFFADAKRFAADKKRARF